MAAKKLCLGKEFNYSSCERHPENYYQFWCSDCKEVLCETCVDSEHQKCNLKMIKYALSSLVSEALQRLPVLENRQYCRNFLELLFSEVKDFKLIGAKYQNDLDLMELKISADELDVLRKIVAGDGAQVDFSVVLKLLKVLKKEKCNILKLTEPHSFGFLISYQNARYPYCDSNTEKVIYQFYKFYVNHCIHEATWLSLFLYLEPLFADYKNYPVNEIRFRLTLHNWNCPFKSVRVDQCHKFDGPGWGREKVIKLSEIEANRGEWLKDGKLCILVKIFGIN